MTWVEEQEIEDRELAEDCLRLAYDTELGYLAEASEDN